MLPVLYECETESLQLREGHMLNVRGQTAEEEIWV
jgi:hypothetical protein